VTQVIQSHPDSLISEMDPQSSATFLSEYQAANGGQLPLFLGTQLTSSSDWITSVIAGVGPASYQKSVKSIVPYVSLSGPGYDLYKTSLLRLGSPVQTPGRFVGNPYAIGDFDSVIITALAMVAANSTSPQAYNSFITKVTDQSPGATVVHNYANGLAALRAGKTIQYVGASGPLVFNPFHSAGRAFSYEDYDPAAKSMKTSSVIPGTALNG
jgi:hypothetical protein